MTKPKSEKRSHKKKTPAPAAESAPRNELPLGNEPGVAPLVIAEIDSAVARYEKAKN